MLETKEKPEASSTSVQPSVLQRLRNRGRLCWQFMRYCLVGGANTAVDLVVLNALLWLFPTTNVMALVGYNSVAYMGGAVSSFFLNKYWTFGHKQQTNAKEVTRFIIVLLIEVLLSNILLWLAGEALRPFIANATLWGNASKIAAVVAGTVITYTFMRFWIFASAQDRAKKPESNLKN
jgi:putative flippase GtrA